MAGEKRGALWYGGAGADAVVRAYRGMYWRCANILNTARYLQMYGIKTGGLLPTGLPSTITPTSYGSSSAMVPT